MFLIFITSIVLAYFFGIIATLYAKEKDSKINKILNHVKYISRYKEKMLWYYEEAVNAWLPVPERLEDVVNVDNLENLDIVTIQFKREDMALNKFESLEEA